jgi:hypothetical protein
VFCFSGRQHWDPTNQEPPSFKTALEFTIYERALETSLWLGQRHAEIVIFQYLQKAANRLYSISPEELSEARGFLDILTCGMRDTGSIVSICNSRYANLNLTNLKLGRGRR